MGMFKNKASNEISKEKMEEASILNNSNEQNFLVE